MEAGPAIDSDLYVEYLECPRKAWYSFREKDLVSEESSLLASLGFATRRIQRRALIEAAAAALMPEGIVDLRGLGLAVRAERTRAAAIGGRTAVMGSAVAHGRFLAEPDLLVFEKGIAAELVRVTSSTNVKERHLIELAWQASVLGSAGLDAAAVRVVRIDRDARPSNDDTGGPFRFLATEDVGTRIAPLRKKAAASCAGMVPALDGACPPPAMADCAEVCGLRKACGKTLPKHHVRTLHAGRALAERLAGKGVTLVADIPEGTRLTHRQRIQVEAVRSNRPHVDVPGIGGFLSKLVFPLAFLDFETFSTALPLFRGLAPWENVPFQFSLHVLEDWDREPECRDFLADEGSDPRPGFLSALLERLPPTGSVVVYNRRFEEGIIRSLAARFPESRERAEAAIPRLLDLLSPFSEFSYYHPEQLGRISMKRVLPCMTGIGYEDLAIGNGADANLAFVGLVLLSRVGGLDEATRSAARKALVDYCSLDSRGMMLMLAELRRLAERKDR